MTLTRFIGWEQSNSRWRVHYYDGVANCGESGKMLVKLYAKGSVPELAGHLDAFILCDRHNKVKAKGGFVTDSQ